MYRVSNNGTGRYTPPRVVILGGGYSGIYAALELQKAAKRGEIELTLISRDNFFLVQPMLAEAISGSIEPLHIVNPIRRMLRWTRFEQAEIEGIDAQSHAVTVRYPNHPHQHVVEYDYLIVAVGTGTDLSALPGVAEHAFPFKILGDALRLRNHLISVLEAAEVEKDPHERRELLTFVVTGGGYTGVEVASEINEFIKEACNSYSRVDADEVKVILLHRADRILPELSEKLANFSHRLLEKRGIEIRLNTSLKSATGQSATLGDGTVIPTRTLVAAVGSAPNRLLDYLPGQRERGRLVVDETLAVEGLSDIWAIGDCASIPDPIEGGTHPPTAQHALREGKQAARNVLAVVRGDEPKPFTYKTLGVFVPLARFSAAAEVMGLKLSGFPAWWLYRTYYLYQLPRLERKLRVVIDWTLDLIFPGDIVYMDVARSQAVTRAHYDPGETIFCQGELAGSFYIIISGEVEVVRDQDHQDVHIANLGAGEYFGEMALLQQGRHTASVKAKTPVDVLVMAGADFTALATSSSRFSELLHSVMRQRLAGTTVNSSRRAE
jgi:NADH dehydrogenase